MCVCYIISKNTAGSRINLEPLLREKILAKGLTLIDNPKVAKYIVDINVLFADNIKEAYAVGMFLDLGLMQKWDDGTLFMVETENMIGSETNWAKIKRKKREKLKNEVQKLSNTSVGLGSKVFKKVGHFFSKRKIKIVLKIFVCRVG